MIRIARVIPVLALGAFTFFPSLPAHAYFINDTGDDFTILWNATGVSGSNQVALSAKAVFDVTSVSSGAIGVKVTFTNTTVLPQDANPGPGILNVTEAGVTSFGMGVTPNATDVDFTDADSTGFIDAVLQDNQQNFPGGFKNIDVCIFTQGCSGGSQNSAVPGNNGSDEFELLIAGDFSSGGTFDPFPIKFQTTIGSFEFGGCVQGTTGCGDFPPVQVPEPGTLALLGAWAVGLGIACRRRKTYSA